MIAEVPGPAKLSAVEQGFHSADALRLGRDGSFANGPEDDGLESRIILPVRNPLFHLQRIGGTPVTLPHVHAAAVSEIAVIDERVAPRIQNHAVTKPDRRTRSDPDRRSTAASEPHMRSLESRVLTVHDESGVRCRASIGSSHVR